METPIEIDLELPEGKVRLKIETYFDRRLKFKRFRSRLLELTTEEGTKIFGDEPVVCISNLANELRRLERLKDA